MRIRCRHGFFTFHEEVLGEVSKFASNFELDLVPYEDAFTFENLADAEEYSLFGKPYLNLPAIKTFEGTPWEILEENDFVYSLALNLIVPIQSIVTTFSLSQSDYYYLADGLLQPGAFSGLGGGRLINYTAWYSFNGKRFRYSEVELDE